MLLKKLWQFLRSWRTDLRARAAKYFVTREVVRVLQLTHAQELRDTPRNEWSLVRQKQVEEIQAVRDGKVFDIVDRRSWCCSEDSEILTREGFKGPYELSEDDEVATLNPETNELEYYKPKSIYREKYKGPMLHFKGRGFNCLVTPNHRMVGRWKWIHYSDNPKPDKVIGRKALSAVTFVQAQEVAEYRNRYKGADYGFEVPFKAKWCGQFPESYNHKTGKITLDCSYERDEHRWRRGYSPVEVSLWDYVAFLGIYTAEGGCAGNYQGVDKKSPQPKYIAAMAAAADNTVYDRSSGYRVSVAQLNTSRHYSKIKQLMSKLPFDFQEEQKGGFYSNSRALHDNVFSCGNTYTKSVPQFIKDLPPKYIRRFIRWYIRGDGIQRPSGAREGYTVSKQLANDLQELFLKIGTQARIKKVKSTAAQYFTASAPERCAPKYIVEENLGRFTSLPKPKTVSYRGLVWCVNVPPNGTILVRRCGQAMWTGNSYPYLPEALHRLRPQTSPY